MTTATQPSVTWVVCVLFVVLVLRGRGEKGSKENSSRSDKCDDSEIQVHVHIKAQEIYSNFIIITHHKYVICYQA